MKPIKSTALSNGLAMFSMFFGAGNITFPLIIGRSVEHHLIWALVGLLMTAVIIPFTGLFAITLFEGNYSRFFNRIGTLPGLLVASLLLGVVGPFGAIPRCVTLTYSTLHLYFPHMHLLLFSFVSCILVFVLCRKQNRIVDLIGYVLSPLLVIFLLVIIIKGIFFTTAQPAETSIPVHPFIYGLKEGYNTMDLIAALFFSSLIYQRLKRDTSSTHKGKHLIAATLKASCIGAACLSGIYIGFSYVAAYQSVALSGISMDQLLGTVGQLILGEHAGLVVCMSIALTCLTTAIALTVVSAEFVQHNLSKGRLSYTWSLLIVLLITLSVSALQFNGIVHLLAPILQLIYPSLIVMSVLNILYKRLGYRPIKTPVAATFLLILYVQYFS